MPSYPSRRATPSPCDTLSKHLNARRSRQPVRIHPPRLIGGLVFAINLISALRRVGDRASLEEECALGQRDELPADFPASIIFDKLGAWDVVDILSGFQGSDLILTFDIRTGNWSFNQRRGGHLQTVVALRSSVEKPIPTLEAGIYYQQVGPWRIALKRRAILPGFKRLRAQEIEALWKMLA